MIRGEHRSASNFSEIVSATADFRNDSDQINHRRRRLRNSPEVRRIVRRRQRIEHEDRCNERPDDTGRDGGAHRNRGRDLERQVGAIGKEQPDGLESGPGIPKFRGERCFDPATWPKSSGAPTALDDG